MPSFRNSGSRIGGSPLTSPDAALPIKDPTPAATTTDTQFQDPRRRYANGNHDDYFLWQPPNNPPPVGCSGEGCELQVFTDDSQLTNDKLREIANRAFQKRASDSTETQATGNFFKDNRLGGPYQKQGETPNLSVTVKNRNYKIEYIKEWHVAFLALLTYDCDCVDQVVLEEFYEQWTQLDEEYPEMPGFHKLKKGWLDPHGQWRDPGLWPDPWGGEGNWDKDMAASKAEVDRLSLKSEGDADKLAGQCWRALLDTPTRYSPLFSGPIVAGRALQEPNHAYGNWVFQAIVRWKNGNVCVKRKIVHLLPTPKRLPGPTPKWGQEDRLEIWDFPVTAAGR